MKQYEFDFDRHIIAKKDYPKGGISKGDVFQYCGDLCDTVTIADVDDFNGKSVRGVPKNIFMD